jgi:peroxiredoxin
MTVTDVAERLQQAFERCRDIDGPLKDRLAAYAAVSRDLMPAYGEAIDRLVARIESNGGGETAPRPGEPMPPFILPDQDGRLVSLPLLLATGPVAVMFHRGHWCPYCRLNVNALVRAQREIAVAGGQVVIVTPERQEFALLFRSNSAAPFPILTDIDNGYALLLNLAIWLDPDLQQILSRRNLPKYHGNDAWMLPIPATFVVGTDGLVKARYVDPDFRRRMDIDELIAAIRAAAKAQ